MKKDFAKWIYWHAQHCRPAEFEPWLRQVRKTGELYWRAGLTGDGGIFKAAYNIAIEESEDYENGCGSCIYHLGDSGESPCSICTRIDDRDPAMEIFHADHHRKIEG
jgi:hypothetical protein